MKKIVIVNRRGIFALPIGDIVYMEKHLRKISLHTMDRKIEFYGKFADVLPFLDSRFLHCHRSYVINMDEIVWMCRNQIYVTTNDEIPFGRDTYGRARKIFTRYMKEKYPERNWTVRKWL